MSVFAKTVLELDHHFDSVRKRHYINNEMVVLHCHHFTALYSQLALDANEPALLADVSEESMHRMLDEYFEELGAEELDERVDLAQQYYAALGLGVLNVDCLGENSGEVSLSVSHVDQGWIKKWGTYDKPVNYITVGYIAALFSACLDLPIKSFAVQEVQSMVMGAKTSKFKIVRK